MNANPVGKVRGCPDPLFLATRYAAGWTLSELADYFGVHTVTVYRWMVRAGIETREAARRRNRRSA